MRTIVCRNTYNHLEHSGVQMDKTRITEQDGALSVPQLIKNQANGLSDLNQDLRQYTDDNLIPQFTDPLDLLAFKEQANLEYKNLLDETVNLTILEQERLKELKKRNKAHKAEMEELTTIY